MLGIIFSIIGVDKLIASMSIFGKDHYIKFCITIFSWLEGLSPIIIMRIMIILKMLCTCVS